MNRRSQILLASIPLLTVAGVSHLSGQTTGKPMNVLFIASDDLSLDMNAFGNPDVKTPNLDRLAKMGTVFTRAYNQCPLSGPSRASLMTGYRPDKIGVYDLAGEFRNARPNAVTLPELFKNNGYYTCRIGKIFHAGVPSEIGLPGSDDPQSWNITYNPVGIDKTGEGDLKGNVTLGTYLAIDGTDNEFTDAISANLACYLLKSRYGSIGSAYGGPARPNAPARNQNQPFFMAVGFYRPHIPYIAPKRYFDMYPPESLKLPEASEEEWKTKPGLARTVVPINAGQSEEECLKALQAYYASVTFVDAQIGTLINVLEELDMINNTIIVFWSDHGYMLGHHGLWQKQNLFEHTASQPLLIYAPGFAGGKPSNKIVELIDIYPTVAQIAGLKPPADIDGKSLVPILENPDVSWNYPAFTSQARTLTQNSNMRMPGGSAEFTFNPSINEKNTTVFGRSVRIDRYRYTEWDEGRRGIELYDYETDMEERQNLAGDKKYRKTEEELKSLLRSSYNNEEVNRVNEIIKKNKIIQ